MKYILFFLMISLTIPSLYAQGGGSVGASDARSTAMGKTYTAASRGVYSIGRNPANLMLSENGAIQFATVLPIPNLNLRTGTDFITINDFNYFFGGVEENGQKKGRYLDEDDKTRLKNIFEGGGFFVTDAGAILLSATYKNSDDVGAFGFSISDRFAFKFNIPEQLMNLGLEGNPIGSVYNFDDADIKGWWLRDYALTYARSLDEIKPDMFKYLSAGISLKLIHGFAYVGTEYVNSKLETGQGNVLSATGNILAYSAFSDAFAIKYDFDSTETEKSRNLGPFPAPAGKGFGMDIGFAAVLDDALSFGLAITDIGSVSWTENTAKFSSDNAVVLKDITNAEQRDSLVNSITGEGEYIDNFSTPLSTALRFGVAFQLDKSELVSDFPGSLLITLDYNQGFNNQPRNSTTPRVSLGFEWKPVDWFATRTGFSFGGSDAFGWAFGLGFDVGVLEMNFATSDLQYLLSPNSAKRVAVSLGSRWKF